MELVNILLRAFLSDSTINDDSLCILANTKKSERCRKPCDLLINHQLNLENMRFNESECWLSCFIKNMFMEMVTEEN